MKKIVLVTGANRGIGKEICRQIAVIGHQVILCSRNKEKGREAAKDLGESVDVQELDVTKESSIERLKTYIEKTYGKLDVLINNYKRNKWSFRKHC